jgi:ABC-type tungstate transport system permease subunit
MRKRRTTLIASLAVVAGLTVTSAAQATQIRLQSTTDINDSGLFTDKIVPGYATAQSGDTLIFTTSPGGTVYPSFVGTGAALDRSKDGLADVVVTHAPSLEAAFVSGGYSYEGLGRATFYNDYVIVGPNSTPGPADPAGVLGSTTRHDAVRAFQAIAARGAGASHDVTFVSRGDNSGTNVQEQILWGLTTGVSLQQATNSADPARKEPVGAGGAGTYPAWYVKNGFGQAASLADANTCATSASPPNPAHPNGGCYTMLDKGTMLKQAPSHLQIVSNDNSSSAIGGASLQANYFHAYAVNPAKAPFKSGVTPNTAAAQRFLDFLVSPGFQGQLPTYFTPPNTRFLPDAFPELQSLPPDCYESTTGDLSYDAAFVYAAPPKNAIHDGMSVTLQSRPTGSSGSWTTQSTATTGSTSGQATLTASGLSGDEDLRLLTGAVDDSFNASHFSAQTSANPVTLGTVSPVSGC